MKELIGKTIVVQSDGQTIKGEMIADYTERILIMSQSTDSTKVISILKHQISFFIVEEKDKTPEEIRKLAQYATGVPLTLIACQNKQMKCPGVKLIANKFDKDIKKEDFESFMGKCPARKETCLCGVIGNVSQLEAKSMVNLLGGLMIGDYPEPS